MQADPLGASEIGRFVFGEGRRHDQAETPGPIQHRGMDGVGQPHQEDVRPGGQQNVKIGRGMPVIADLANAALDDATPHIVVERHPTAHRHQPVLDAELAQEGLVGTGVGGDPHHRRPDQGGVPQRGGQARLRLGARRQYQHGLLLLRLAAALVGHRRP